MSVQNMLLSLGLCLQATIYMSLHVLHTCCVLLEPKFIFHSVNLNCFCGIQGEISFCWLQFVVVYQKKDNADLKCITCKSHTYDLLSSLAKSLSRVAYNNFSTK